MAPSWITVRIASKLKLAEDIQSFDLVAADGGELPAYTAGSHIDVEIRPGLIRQYSICLPPNQISAYRIAVLRDPTSRGGSVAMHDELLDGQTVRISPPRNLFELDPSAERTILLAGGIGVTPILSMAGQLCRDGRAFSMHYCARTQDRAAFYSDITSGELAPFSHLYFDEGPQASRLDLERVLAEPDEGAHVYVCGPAGFIDWVFNMAEKCGWQRANLHREYFGAEASASVADSEAFDVKIASTGNVYTIPGGQNVTEVLARQGIDIPVSCQQGVCGTCITRVLEGVPDHRDLVLMGDEMDEFTPCCSRSKTPMLVLDL